LGVDLREVLAVLFDGWKLNGLGVISNRHLRDFPGLAAFLKGSVIKFSTTIKPALESMSDWFCWFDAKFIRLYKLFSIQQINLMQTLSVSAASSGLQRNEIHQSAKADSPLSWGFIEGRRPVFYPSYLDKSSDSSSESRKRYNKTGKGKAVFCVPLLRPVFVI
jgi:hypothetical protein